MDNTQKILFIGHDASRTGAPMMLYHFLKWLKTYTNIPFVILLKEGGELITEFEALAPVFLFNNAYPLKSNTIGGKLSQIPLLRSFMLRMSLKLLKERLICEHINLIYANTITNAEILDFLGHLQCPVISHVHELEFWIRYQTGIEHFNRVKYHTSHYIAVSRAVTKNLMDQHNIPGEVISTIHESIPTKLYPLHVDEKHGAIRQRIGAQFNIPEEAKIVCASGTTDWRKGPDLFIQLARSIYHKRRSYPVHFLWVGGDCDGFQFGQLWHDVVALGLEHIVHFIGKQSNPTMYFEACDAFTLMSREDPFPLVCLEAAAVGKPIVCFENSGGMPEFVEDDCGYVVPYLDIESMAAKILDLLDSPAVRQRFGQRARQKVQERHDIGVSAPQILSVIQQFMNSGSVLTNLTI